MSETADMIARKVMRVRDNVLGQCLTNALGPDWDFESLKGRITYRVDMLWGKDQTTYWLDGKILVTFTIPEQPMPVYDSTEFKMQCETPHWETA